MRDQENGRAGAPPQAQHLVAHQQPCLRIERAERLVEQDKARLQHERAGDADTLPHAAGKLRGIGAGEVRQSHEGQRVIDAAADFRVDDAVTTQAERGVVPHRQPRKASILLEDDADAVRHLARDWTALERHRAGGGLLQAGQHLQQSGLAAAGRTDDGEKLAALQVELDRVRAHEPVACRRPPDRSASRPRGRRGFSDPARCSSFLQVGRQE